MTTWDERKRTANIRKHGVDLAIAEDFDFTTALIVEDSSASAREQREVALGWIGERLFVYVYTLRGDEDHAISLRLAEPKERRRYAENI
jgi:uncharacterized DUF497 family protein